MFAGGIGVTIAKWFLGSGLTSLGKIGVDLYKEKLSAENTTENHVATLASRAMELDEREAELNNKLLIAEQGNAFTRWVRPVWAAPFVIWTWKVVVWDITLQAWTHSTTIDLKGTPGTLCIVIATAYFGERGVMKVMDKIAMMRGLVTGGKR